MPATITTTKGARLTLTSCSVHNELSVPEGLRLKILNKN